MGALRTVAGRDNSVDRGQGFGRNHYPVQVAEYAGANKIVEEPPFSKMMGT